MHPLVTVLMPVYNGEKHLAEAVQSILDQTYRNFEFLVMDDGSTDGSAEIIASFKDERIMLNRAENNEGITKTLNRGIGIAKGFYIARMDCDDISHPQRLMRQVNFLEEHPETGVLGTAIEQIKKNGPGKTKRWPATDAEIKINMLFQNPLYHPTVMVRREALANTRYPESMRYAQDYSLWTALSPVTRFANLPEALLRYRTHPGQVTKTKAAEQATNARIVRENYLQSLFPEADETERALHHRISERDRTIDLEASALWFEKMISLNESKTVFPRKTFEKILARKWWNCCKNSRSGGMRIWKSYRQCSLSKVRTDERKNIPKYAVKWMFNKP